MPYATILFDKIFDVKNVKVSHDKLFPISENLLNNSSYFLSRQNLDGVVILEYLNSKSSTDNNNIDDYLKLHNEIPDIDDNLNFDPYQIWNLYDNKSMKKLIMYSSYYDLWKTDIFKTAINNVVELDISLDKFPPDTSDLVYYKYLEVESKMFWTLYKYGANFMNLYNKLSDIEVFTCMDAINTNSLWMYMHQDLIVHPKVVNKYRTYKYILCSISAKKILSIYMNLNIKMNLEFLKVLSNYNHYDITPVPSEIKLYCTHNFKKRKPKYSLLNCVLGFNVYTSLLYTIFVEAAEYSTSLFLHPILNCPYDEDGVSIYTIYLLKTDMDKIMRFIIENNYVVIQINTYVFKISFVKMILILIFDNEVPNKNFEVLCKKGEPTLIFSPMLGIALITGNYLGNLDISVYLQYFRILDKLDDSYTLYKSELPEASTNICPNIINNVSDDDIIIQNFYLYIEQYTFIYVEDYDGYVLTNVYDSNRKNFPPCDKIDMSKILYYYISTDDEDNVTEFVLKKVGCYIIQKYTDDGILLINHLTNEILENQICPLIYLSNGTLYPFDTLLVENIPDLIIKQNYNEHIKSLDDFCKFDVNDCYKQCVDNFISESNCQGVLSEDNHLIEEP